MTQRHETESPFYVLVEAAGEFADNPLAAEPRAALFKILGKCVDSANQAHQSLDDSGVSSNLVFRLDFLVEQLKRIRALLLLGSGQGDARRFAATLVRGFAEQRGIVNLLRGAGTRLARQMVEHTGRAGEHYIAWSQEHHGLHRALQIYVGRPSTGPVVDRYLA